MRRSLLFVLVLFSSSAFAADPVPLFQSVGPQNFANLPEHASAAQAVRIDRRALRAASIEIDIFGEVLTAERLSVESQSQGTFVWIGHLAGNPADSVVLTSRGPEFSGLIQHGESMYRLGRTAQGGNRLLQIDLESLPGEDADALPDGFGTSAPAGSAGTTANDGVVQDLLVAYNQGACNYTGGCGQLEADIVTAIADLNAAYAASGINITMNLVGMAFTDYVDPSSASTALSDLRGTSDGQMDELHALRDDLGADLVALIYNGPGCGIGYLRSSASTAFSVTDVPCMVGNRTLAHELGHNQGAHHDRTTVGGGTDGAYNYGYRRCSDGSAENVGSPYFRTILAYPCSGAPRVGRFSNPNVNYSGVPQGIDPDVDPSGGAWNARMLNESASYVAGFRQGSSATPPTAPGALSALAAEYDVIELAWSDNSNDETSFVLESSLDQSSWSEIATLAAGTTNYVQDGLQPDTTYYFRVKARNSAGDSGYSNTASARTPVAPAFILDVANGESGNDGSVSGTYVATQADDGQVQTITETGSGPKRRRSQSYAHRWSFDVAGAAGGVTFTANAWVSGSEGALFRYSTDGGASWANMFSVDATSSDNVQFFVMPPATQGLVWVEARDAARQNGEGVDTLSIDYLVMTSVADAGTPPAAPSTPSVTGTTASSVSLSFLDNSSDEFGFEIHRGTADPGGSCSAGSIVGSLPASPSTGSVGFTDTTAAPSTTYWYWVGAFNGAGDSCSGAVSASTLEGSAINANANPYKVRGVHHIDLSWTGASGATVDVRRNGTVIATTDNDGAYTDVTGSKGGGSYSYQVCEAGSTANCSDTQNVVF